VRVFLSQNALEPALKEAAERYGARIRFATECVSLEQDASGVTAIIRQRDTAETLKVRAQYLIAADGARGRIRQQLGIGMRGHGTFSKSVTIYFRADLPPFPRRQTRGVVYANHPELRGFFRFEKPFESAFLVVNTLGDVAAPNADVSTGLTNDRALELVRTAIGVPDIPGHDRERDALERDGRHSRALSRRPYLHRRRRSPPHAADRRLGRQHGRAGCTQPRVEARARARGNSGGGPFSHVRAGAPPGRRVHRRAGVYALCAADRSVDAPGSHPAARE
jgi:2-polyprenyl-6-methoxyphenol hydroxylase-like FAD-dependent oxidoreductase